MGLKTKVKVGNITNLSDARYCSGMGVDFLGFPINDLTLDIKNYREITTWVSGPALVLEWHTHEVPPQLNELRSNYNADYVELRVHNLEKIASAKNQLIITLDIGDWNLFKGILRDNKKKIAFLSLVSTEHNAVDRDLIKEIAEEFPVLLGFGVSERNLDVILSLPIAGLSLQGTTEDSPGLKDYSTLSGILEQLEV